MHNNKPIRREEVIGKFVKSVSFIDLPYDSKAKYQPRKTIVELDSGLRFVTIQASEIIDPASKLGLVYPYLDTAKMRPVLQLGKEPNLASPIRALFLPYGWINSCGVMLENDFAIHAGISDMEDDFWFEFYNPSQKKKLKFVEFSLPD